MGLTGDGVALAYRHGIPMEDMEFYQFHPTGIVGIGILLSEAARGEGGYLLNGEGERFMERLRAEADGARAARHGLPRDLPGGPGRAGRSAARTTSILDIRHLGRKVIEEKLPDITDFARVYLGVEPITEPMPIQPTAHYAMGGIPTDLNGRVIRDAAGHRGARAVRGGRGGLRVASTARTGWGRTRWSTCWCSAGAPAARWPRT